MVKIKGEQLAMVFSLVVRLVVGCMFVVSSLPKIRQPYDFLSSVYSYELVGPKLGVFVAMVLPWAELLVGLCLIGGIFVGGALLVSVAMGAMFVYVVGSALWRGLEISCGCFGPSDASVIGYATLVRAAAIAVFSFCAYLCYIQFQPRAAGLQRSR